MIDIFVLNQVNRLVFAFRRMQAYLKLSAAFWNQAMIRWTRQILCGDQ